MNQPTNGKLIKSEKVLELLEGIGVIMRIMAFGTLSILGKDTPFLWMWIWNTIDAIILTYAAWERNNKPYILMNTFWLLVGIVGIYTSIYGNPISH
jgi:phosphoglycerol transferase MdoB-like AlkP superfamily enzyme